MTGVPVRCSGCPFATETKDPIEVFNRISLSCGGGTGNQFKALYKKSSNELQIAIFISWMVMGFDRI
jgi:hypothetical protein